MHRRVLPVLVASTVTVGLVGLAGPAAVANDNSQQHPKKRPTLTLYGTETAFTSISATGVVGEAAEEEPPTAGARFLSVDTLYSDAARTQRVGRNDIQCTFTEVTGTTDDDFGASLLCSGVVQLDGQGDLTWQASASFGPDDEPEGPYATVAITGGTGAFKAAGGQADLFDESPEPAEGEDEDDGESLTRYEVDLLNLKAGRH